MSPSPVANFSFFVNRAVPIDIFKIDLHNLTSK